jgi:hypothetical protein
MRPFARPTYLKFFRYISLYRLIPKKITLPPMIENPGLADRFDPAQLRSRSHGISKESDPSPGTINLMRADHPLSPPMIENPVWQIDSILLSSDLDHTASAKNLIPGRSPGTNNNTNFLNIIKTKYSRSCPLLSPCVLGFLTFQK